MEIANRTCEDVGLPASLSWITATISIVLSIVTIPGNVLIIIAVLKDPNQDLRTTFNYFVINLVISDLMLGLVTEPMFAVYHILEANQVTQPTGVVHVTYFCSFTVSLLSLAALAHDRCKAVTSKYRRASNSTRSLKMSIAIWCISFSLPWVYFAIDFYVFAFVYVNTAILVSLIIVVVSFYRVKEDLRVNVMEWQSIGHNAGRLRAIKREQKLTNSFLLLLVFFVGCLAPSFVIAYVINFCTVCSCDVINWLRDSYFLLPLVNSAVNQFLYPWRMRNFRLAVYSIIECNIIQRVFPKLSPAEKNVNVNQDGPEVSYKNSEVHVTLERVISGRGEPGIESPLSPSSRRVSPQSSEEPRS